MCLDPPITHPADQKHILPSALLKNMPVLTFKRQNESLNELQKAAGRWVYSNKKIKIKGSSNLQTTD